MPTQGQPLDLIMRKETTRRPVDSTTADDSLRHLEDGAEADTDKAQEASIAPLHWTRRWVYLSLAAIFFLLGMVGLLLPIVPTTPFLLVTSYFLVRSFPKLNLLLLKAPYFGAILYDWEVRKGIKWSVKVQAIATVLIGWGISIAVFPVPWWAMVIMALLVVIGVAYIMRIPPPRDPVDSENSNPAQPP